MAISTNGAIITRLAGALYGEYLSNATYEEVKDTSAATVAANWLSNDFAGKTDLQVAKTILTNLGLTSITGLDNWLSAQLTAAGSTSAAKGAALVSILNGYAGMASDATYGSYATSFNTKVAASLVLSQTVGNAGGAFGTSDTVAVKAATFTLTTGTDSFTGTSSNDVFNGALSSTSQTFGAGDNLDGGAGTDSLTATMSGSATPTALKNIEEIAITATGTVTLGLLNANAETLVKNVGSTGALTFSNLDDLNTKLAVSNVGDLNTTFAFKAATVTGTADAVSLELDDVNTTTDGNGVTIASVETINVTATGGDSVLKDLNASSATKLTVAGAAKFTVTDALAAATVVVDASASTGGVVLGLTTATATVTGGSGNDTIDIKAADGTSVIDLGAGNDTIVANATGLLLGTTGADTVSGGEGNDIIKNVSAQFEVLDNSTQTNITGFETLFYSDTATTTETVDATKIAGINKVVFAEGSAGSYGITFATGGGTFQHGDSTAGTTHTLGGALTLTVDGTSQSDAVSYVYGNTSSDNNAKNIIGSGVETLTVTNTKAADTLGAVTLTGTAGSSTKVAIAGTKAMTFGAISANSIDASGLSAAAGLTMVSGTATNVTGGAGNDTLYGAAATASTVDGGEGKDTIYGGSGNDSLVGGAGNDSITTGAGSDKVNAGAGADTIILAGNLSSADVIDGGDDADKIQISAQVTDSTAGASVVNVETLDITGATVSQDVSLFSATTLATVLGSDTSSALTLTGVGANTNLAFSGATPGTSSIARGVDASANALTVTLGSASAGTGSTVTQLTANNEETITLTAVGDASAITTLVATDLRTLNVTGSKNISIPTLTIDTGSTTSGAVTINASAATGTVNVGGTANNATIYSPITFTAGVGATTVRGGAGADTITGSGADDSVIGAAGADSITAGAGNDIINAGQGADYIDGGDGLDTYQSGVVPGTDVDGGVTAITGVFINLGSTTKSVADVNTATVHLNTNGGYFTAGSIIDVASKTAVNLFAASAGAASSRVDTLVNIENATGTTGADYIIGSSAANVITGGDGVDVLTGGSSADSFVFSGDDASNGTVTLAAGAVTFTAATNWTIAALDTIVDAEVITDLSSTDGSGETIVLGNADAALSANLVLADDEYIFVQGTYTAASGSFAVGTSGTTGDDSALIFDSDSTTGIQWNIVILVGINSTEAAYIAVSGGTLTV